MQLAQDLIENRAIADAMDCQMTRISRIRTPRATTTTAALLVAVMLVFAALPGGSMASHAPSAEAQPERVAQPTVCQRDKAAKPEASATARG